MNDNNVENNNNKDKKDKKTLSLTIPAIILYSTALIAIMFGVFWGVEKLLAKSPKAPLSPAETTTETETTPPSSEVTSETVSSTDTTSAETPVEEEDWIDVSMIMSGENNTIDYTAVFYEPNKRNTKLVWKDTIFSKLENIQDPSSALINSYTMTRKWATREDGKKMEFEVYSNPDTSQIEKITAIEHCGDYLEIIDYYYDNGKINYISQHQTIINTPIDIASADITNRYYFNQDTMVKFSSVENQTAYEYQVSKLNEYSSGTIKQYDYLEDTMINWAYITYKVVSALPETEYIEGYVFDVFNSAMADAEVNLLASTTGNTIMTTKTNGDGLYSFIAPVNNQETYTIQIKKPTLDNANIYNVAAGSGSSAYYAKPVFMSYTQDGAIYNVQVSLRDASANGSGIEGSSLKVRAGLDNKKGDIIAAGTADSLGNAVVALAAGSYTGELSKTGYETSYFPIVVEMSQTTAYGYTVPDLSDNEYQFVVSWNTSSLDLDALLFTNSPNQTIESSIDSIGNTSAELISLKQPESGVYRFFLYDYTNCTGENVMSYAMSTANALVTVFNADGYIDSYSAPIGHGGVIWDVCRLQGGHLTSIGDYYTVFQPDSYWTRK